MQKLTKEIVLEYNIEKVYNFFRNFNNYLSESDGVSINNTGTSVKKRIVGFGILEAHISDLVENQKITIYSKEINTSIKAILEKIGEYKTKILLTTISDPSCGFLKNMFIYSHVPDIFDNIVSSIKKIKI